MGLLVSELHDQLCLMRSSLGFRVCVAGAVVILLGFGGGGEPMPEDSHHLQPGACLSEAQGFGGSGGLRACSLAPRLGLDPACGPGGISFVPLPLSACPSPG